MDSSVCEGLTGERLAFCTAGTQPFISDQAALYRQHRDQCNWHKEPATAFDIDSVICRNFTRYGQMITHTFRPDVSVCERQAPELISCVMDDWHDPEATWRVLRAGPFTTRGGPGYDWTELTMNNVLGGTFAEGLAGSGRLYMTASSMGPLWPNGTAIAYPPLHVHHAHLTRSFQSPMREVAPTGEPSAVFQNAVNFLHHDLHIDDFTFHVHGDSPCASDRGGVDCYMLTLPPGYGYRTPLGPDGLDARIFFNTEINDVRSAGAPPITWYIETGFRATRAPRRLVGKFFFSGAIGFHIPALLPSREELSDLYLADYFFRISNQLHMATWMIPEADSLWWSSTPMHTSGTFAYAGFGLSHAHQPYSKGYWIIQGTPEQAGLHDERFDQCAEGPVKGFLSHIGMPILFMLEEHGMTIESVQRHVNTSLEASAEACKREGGCRFLPQLRCTAGTGLEHYSATDDGIEAGWYDRMPFPHCNFSSWHFERGDVFTAMYFMGRVHPEDSHVPHVPFAMHAAVGAYVIESNVPWKEEEYDMNWRYHNPWPDPPTAFNYYLLGNVINASVPGRPRCDGWYGYVPRFIMWPFLLPPSLLTPFFIGISLWGLFFFSVVTYLVLRVCCGCCKSRSKSREALL